jgi:hypothetical protein
MKYIERQTPQAPVNKEEVHDRANSVLSCTVYHENYWLYDGKKCNATFHYLKYMNESADYRPGTEDQVEFGRVVRVVSSKVTGPFKENAIKTICVYINKNQGGKIKGVQNPLILKIVFRNKQITSIENLLSEQEWRDFADSIVNQIEKIIHQSTHQR